MMKSVAKFILRALSQSKTASSLLDRTLIRSADYFRIHTKETLRPSTLNTPLPEEVKRYFDQHVAELRVKSGPFSGMQYTDTKAVCSAIAPKLLGTYETELQSNIEDLIRRRPEVIIDIGCAEGYYAVGLALRLPSTTVHAYDTDDEARTLCLSMANQNGVSERVHVHASMDTAELLRVSKLSRCLIISDCEGYESHLFVNRELAIALASHDLIIETHDFLDIEISGKIEEAFRETHHVTRIQSIDDIRKAKTYAIPGADDLTLSQRKELVKEGRPGVMEWLVLRSKCFGV